MKALLALLFGISMVAISIYLHIEKKIDLKSMSAIFTLAIIGGLVIANFDVLKRWKGLGVEVEIARDEIEVIKADALTEIQTQVEDHKNAISVLMRSASDLSDKLEKQRTLAEALVAKAEGLESEIEKDQKQLSAVKADVLDAGRQTQAAKAATEELARVLTRIVSLQSQVRGEFGNSPRLQKVSELINQDLNRLLSIMMPDPAERQQFVNELMSALPER